MSYYDALLSVMDLLHDRIHPHQYQIFPSGTLQLMGSLHEKFASLEDSLKDYSSNHDMDADRVEASIRDVAWKAHDIIEFEYAEQIEPENVLVRALHRFTNNEDQNPRLKMVKQEIDSILERLLAIKERQRKKKLQLNNDSSTTTGEPEQVHTHGGRNIMAGYVKCMNEIKDQLCGNSSHRQVISIVGSSGIGKTTLAGNIFDDALVLHQFDHRAWAVASQSYSFKNVLQSLLTSMGVNADELRGKRKGELKEKLYRSLKGKRYIIVIDDVWSAQVWDDLKRVLPGDSQGSRIMLTTQLMKVAQYVSTSGFVHEMEYLDAEDSWTLLQEKVFGKNCCPPDLENIGRSIASKCHGLPLAIVVMGGLLSNAKKPQDWEEISRNMSTILNGDDEHLSKIFTLSFNHLSHQQKTCFLYMGRFPEDYQISISNLIMLWIAEGFLKSNDESKSLEKLGEECLEDLVNRSLVLVTKKRDSGKLKLCVLHDLVREFCKCKAHHQNFFADYGVNEREDDNRRDIENVRRANVHLEGNSFRGYPLAYGTCLRSFLMFGQHNTTYLNGIKWDEHKLLRVLGCHDGKFADSIPDAIYEMSHLKYLRWNVQVRTFTDEDSEALHFPTLSALKDLQSLIIDKLGNCDVYLPFWKLTKLRHVSISGMRLPRFPMVSDTCVVKLEDLQTLMTVHGFQFTQEAIGMFPNLRKLKTYYVSSEFDSDSSGRRRNLLEVSNLNNLVNLLKLEELKISFYFKEHHVTDFPRGLNFPINITKLSLTGNGFSFDCLTAASSLPNLQVLKIEYFSGSKWEPLEGGFQSLKVLKIKNIKHLDWEAEGSHFPCLECLHISICYSLMIPPEIGDIPTLKLIEVCQSGTETKVSALQIQEERRNDGNDIQVRIMLVDFGPDPDVTSPRPGMLGRAGSSAHRRGEFTLNSLE